MYVNVETIPGMGVRGIKENGDSGGGEINYDIFDTL
jgi:hypothetical protein